MRRHERLIRGSRTAAFFIPGEDETLRAISTPLGRGLLAVLILLAASPVATARKKPPPPYRIVPGPYVKNAPPPAEQPAPSRFVLKGLTVVLEYLQPPARFEFIEGIDPKLGDPFGVAPGQPQRFLAFRVTFQNASSGDVVFQPGNVILATDRKEHRFPVDLTDMYRIASIRKVKNPEDAMNRIAPIIFDSSTVIRQGDEMTRLLVFRQVPGKWKEFGLHFSFIQIDSETHTLSFSFHKHVLKD